MAIAVTQQDAHSEDYLRGLKAGQQLERDYIIKLLEDENNCDGGLSNGNCTCTAIALIKGANK